MRLPYLDVPARNAGLHRPRRGPRPGTTARWLLIFDNADDPKPLEPR
jgi:hypothetical protein